MDKEEARFILRCFRPDGADAENPDFVEALGWAAKDRELGEWLARERSSDADFAKALGQVVIPETLREEIVSALALERGEVRLEKDDFDVMMIAALGGLCALPALRGEVLAAMARTIRPKRPWWAAWKFAAPAAAAAGVALAFTFSGRSGAPVAGDALVDAGDATREDGIDPSPSSGLVPISMVEEGFIREFESPGFTLDLTDPDHHALFDHLKSAKLPCPNTCLPKGLKKIPGLGCRELHINGKRGALVCFKQENEIVHLVVFKRCDVKCRLPQREKPNIGKHGKWAVARWADRDWVFVLMGEDEKGVDPERLANMF